MNITITNTALINTGDAAILFGTLEILERAFGKNVHISLRDQQADTARRLYPDHPVAPLFDNHGGLGGSGFRRKVALVRMFAASLCWRLPSRELAMKIAPKSHRKALRQYLESDLIISAGGTYLVPHYRVTPKVVELLIASLSGTPYLLFTQSLGPFLPQRRLLKFVLQRARVVIVRDTRSKLHLVQVGVDPSRIHVCADAAFAIPPSKEPVAPPKSNRKTIGISVRDWPHADGASADMTNRYLDAMAELADHLVRRHKARVFFVSACQGVSEYWTDDSSIAERVVERLEPMVAEQVRIDRDFHRPDELRDYLATLDLFVSTRMHGAILALLAGIPVLPIAYEFKTSELFEQMDLKHLVHHFENVDGAALARDADLLLTDNATMRRRITLETSALQASAISAADSVAKVLEKNQ